MSDGRRTKPPGHSDGNWQRWQMGELHHLRPTAPGEAPLRSQDQQKIDLDGLRARARQTGHDQGYKAGFAAGREAGYQEGVVAGRSDGHAQGLEDGRQQAAEELKQHISAMTEPLGALLTHFTAALDQLENDVSNALVELALATGRQLARESLDSHPEVILTIVRELLHSEPALSGKPRLWLHPDDLTIVREHLGAEFEAAGWRLQPDDQITSGGCRVSSPSGELDATWESRWLAIRAQIRQRPVGDVGNGELH